MSYNSYPISVGRPLPEYFRGDSETSIITIDDIGNIIMLYRWKDPTAEEIQQVSRVIRGFSVVRFTNGGVNLIFISTNSEGLPAPVVVPVVQVPRNMHSGVYSILHILDDQRTNTVKAIRNGVIPPVELIRMICDCDVNVPPADQQRQAEYSQNLLRGNFIDQVPTWIYHVTAGGFHRLNTNNRDELVRQLNYRVIGTL